MDPKCLVKSTNIYCYGIINVDNRWCKKMFDVLICFITKEKSIYDLIVD
jgi:hypothetical protein